MSISILRAGYHANNRLGKMNFSFGIETLLTNTTREHHDWGGITRLGMNDYSTHELDSDKGLHVSKLDYIMRNARW